MSFYEIVSKCTSNDKEYKDTDCSKAAFTNEYLKDVNANNAIEAMAAAKPGDTLEIKVLDSLTPTQDKYISVFLDQIAWSRPYDKAVNDLPATLDKMAPAQARKYVDEQMKAASLLKAPGEEAYPKLESGPESSDPLRNLGFHSPDHISSQNEKTASYQHARLRDTAIKYFDDHKQYDDVRDLIKELPVGHNYWDQYTQASWLHRPEVDISSKQQLRIGQIFDTLDRNGNGELSESELKKALKSSSLGAEDKEIVRLLDKHREQLALGNDDSIFFTEKAISKEDLKHIGHYVDDQPGKFFEPIRHPKLKDTTYGPGNFLSW